jgi:hypothetical protein
MHCPICGYEARDLTPRDFDIGGVVLDCRKCGGEYDVANGYYMEKLRTLSQFERGEILAKAKRLSLSARPSINGLCFLK